ncbi:MAG: hypothetical protein A3E36_02030 [Candidatus Andersenbacteria bacterium RIFCSPHIGHO2_12_FULL_45_11b]|uniref:Acetolactate synthase n=1 Tax=Candidatus Andersenbacteria bacterium RIFCSPHIGHO2_12_FULL_45_11b TaxID=1797282 RepID=A0A1G1XBF1_9BACT|nr:MAG: hypothetical protein A3E36_02030 [Candidatus Andersenbacteria bacterium RIFCSPHIGHO2_12_FULL_45_11b]
MKLSDYIAQFLVEQGIRHAFVLSGGAAVHMIDSIARNPKIDYVCPQHEEQEAMSADAYSRITGNLGVGITTSGPGGTNLLTGVCCSYFDSIPTLFLTGQVARFRLKPTATMRQMGFQETDMQSIYKSVTKYAVQIQDPSRIRYELEKAVHIAKEGRPGPVLVDIPDDLQREEIEPDMLPSYFEEMLHNAVTRIDKTHEIQGLLEMITSAKRPVFVYGAGVHISHTEADARRIADILQIPFLLTWGAMDIWPHTHPLNAGGVGVCGPRSGNFIVQNADLIVGIGTRFSQMIVGGKAEYFGREARKVMIDIDPEELGKFTGTGMTIDLPIQSSLQEFLPQLETLLATYAVLARPEWAKYVQGIKTAFPMCVPGDYETKKAVDANVFIDALSAEAKEGDIVLTDAGGNLTWTMQGFKVKEGQRLFSAWNHSPMGYSLAGAIGAAFADPTKDVIAIIGDGGLQMCIEELATVARYNLPIKLFIFNNQGHGIQKQTIETWLEGRYEALDRASGLFFPNFITIAKAYELPSAGIISHTDINGQIHRILNTKGPMVIDVAINPDQRILPMLTFGRPLEDQGPLLDRKEFLRHMIIDPLREST